MMTLDQFETEPNAFYSGSYTDAIYRGSMGAPGGRFRVASFVSGSNEFLYADHYSDYVDYSGSNRSRSLGISNTFRGFFSSDERYQDTVLPDILGAFLLNGGLPVVAYSDYDSSPVLTTEFDAYVQAVAVGKLVFTTFGTTASYTVPTSVKVSDGVWFGSSPFQGRYRNIQRDTIGQFYRTNIACPATESQWTSAGVYHYGFNDTFLPATTLATIEIITPSTGSEFNRYTLIDVSGRVLSDETFLGSFAGADTIAYPPPGTAYFNVSQGTKRPNQKQLTKALFGFGDNYQGVPIVNAVSAANLASTSAAPNVFYVSSIEIRGWRYGVVNGFPFYSSCVFRSSRYGQFRDMLEQRKATKFFDPNEFNTSGRGRENGSSAVVLTSFVSGSKAHVTASSPAVLNPNDSGIYDFECKSGQPWHD